MGQRKVLATVCSREALSDGPHLIESVHRAPTSSSAWGTGSIPYGENIHASRKETASGRKQGSYTCERVTPCIQGPLDASVLAS